MEVELTLGVGDSGILNLYPLSASGQWQVATVK